MPVITMPSPPVLCDGTEYGAGLLRRLFGAMLADTVGVFEDDDFDVSLSGSTVTVMPGRAALPSTATETSVYLVEANTASTLTLDPADATRDRKDVLVAYVVPPATPADVGVWKLEIVTGEASTTPTAPTVPYALLLREFLVPSAAVGTQPSSTDKRFTDGQQLISGPTLYGDTQPFIGRPGQIWTNSTTREAWLYDGGDWVRVRGVPVVGSTAEVLNPYNGMLVVAADGITWQRYAGVWRPAGPLGVIGGRRITGPNALGGAVSNTELQPANMDSGPVSLLSNRQYLIRVRYKAQGSIANNDFILMIREGTAPGTSGNPLRQYVHNTGNPAFGYTGEITADYATGASPVTRVFALTASRLNGTGILQFQGGDAGSTNVVGVVVHDVGPAGKLTTTAS